MSREENVIVLMKDGISYFQKRPFWRDKPRVNGQDDVTEPCPGNEAWLQYTGTIETLETVRNVPHTCVGYRLSSRVVDKLATVLPETLPADAFPYDIDDGVGGDWAAYVEFYKSVLEPQPPVVTPIPFKVLDYDCEPVDLPSYVHVDFPDFLKHHKALHHKFPCRIHYKDVYELVAEALVEIVNSNSHLTCNDHRNIQVLRVNEIVNKAGPRGKPLQSEVLYIVGEYREKGGAIQIKNIKGETYEDLQANLGAYIVELAKPLLRGQRVACPTCGGHGVINEQE